MTAAVATCPGPLVWFEVGEPADAGILECHTCGYLIVTGSFHDEAHAYTELLREGLNPS